MSSSKQTVPQGLSVEKRTDERPLVNTRGHESAYESLSSGLVSSPPNVVATKFGVLYLRTAIMP